MSRRWLLPIEGLRGTRAPISAGQPLGGTGRPAQEAVAAYRALAGHRRPYRCGPTT